MIRRTAPSSAPISAPRTRTVLTGLMLAFCCLCNVGCINVKAPALAVESVRLTEQTDEAFVIVFDMELENLNQEPQELDEFTYTVAVNGTQVYSGRRSAEMTLASRRSKIIGLPAVVHYDALGLQPGNVPAEVRYSINGELVYLTPGAWEEMLFDAGVRTPSIGFSDKGEASLR